MSLKHWLSGLALLVLVATGCGQNGGTGQATGSAKVDAADAVNETTSSGETQSVEAIQRQGPAAVVAQFLEAYRNGDDEKAMPWLSTVAKQKMAEEHVNVTPEKSETARFEIGAVEYLTPDGKTSATYAADCTGARVDSKLIDTDDSGTPQADRIVWVVRRESNRWGVAGMAAYVFQSEPPLLLNYEDPAEMIKKQQWLREEMARRDQQTPPAAQVDKNSKDSIRR
jgi:hypothetical protein